MTPTSLVTFSELQAFLIAVDNQLHGPGVVSSATATQEIAQVDEHKFFPPLSRSLAVQSSNLHWRARRKQPSVDPRASEAYAFSTADARVPQPTARDLSSECCFVDRHDGGRFAKAEPGIGVRSGGRKRQRFGH
jgi:hypothetical protein